MTADKHVVEPKASLASTTTSGSNGSGTLCAWEACGVKAARSIGEPGLRETPLADHKKLPEGPHFFAAKLPKTDSVTCTYVKLSPPGVEPGLSRPRRDVLTTRR